MLLAIGAFRAKGAAAIFVKAGPTANVARGCVAAIRAMEMGLEILVIDAVLIAVGPANAIGAASLLVVARPIGALKAKGAAVIRVTGAPRVIEEVLMAPGSLGVSAMDDGAVSASGVAIGVAILDTGALKAIGAAIFAPGN